MRCAERVVDIEIAQPGQFFRKCRIVLFFLGMKAQIFEQQHFAGRGLHRLHFRANAIRGHLDGPA